MGRMANHLLALCDNIKNPLSATSTAVLAAPAAQPPADGAEPTDAEPAAAAAAVATSATDFAETARNVFRMRLTAALAREVLKMGSSRAEKAAVKEFVRVMGTLCPPAWLRDDLAPTVLAVADTIAQCCPLEKGSAKVLVEKVGAPCEARCPAVLPDEGDAVVSAARFQFFNLAPGLGDMMELTSRDLDADKTKDLRLGCREALRAAPSSSAPGPAKRAPRGGARKATKGGRRSGDDSDEDDDEDDEEEEEEEDEELPVPAKGGRGKVLPPAPPVAAASARPTRSSKAAAASKIASIADQENMGHANY